MVSIPSASSTPRAFSRTSTSIRRMPTPLLGCTSVGARPSPHRKLSVAASRATAYKPWIASPPTGAHSSKLTGTACTTTAKSSTSTSSTLSSAVRLLHTSTNEIMSKIKIKVTINLEHMSSDEQMRYFIRLADKGLLPPCPPEIRRKYEKPTDK